MKKLLLIVLLWETDRGQAQLPAGVMEPAGPGGFSVVDCFRDPAFSGGFKTDSLRANDVLKGTTIWRSISLDQPQNQAVFSSGNRCTEIGLFEIIKFGLLEKQLNAFYSDEFKQAAVSRLSREQILAVLLLRDSSEVMSFDADGNSRPEKIRTNRYLVGQDIRGYLLKEDWVLNSYSGKMEKYILGLAPLVYDRAKEKVLPLFWLYYPEWKKLLGLFEARNFYSYEPVSFRDVLEKNYFTSLISRESNVFERGVRTYRRGDEASLESERIREKLENSERDLFQH